MNKSIILGIETSCDDTSFGIINSDLKVLLFEHFSQAAIHNNYGGVFPDLASKNHLLRLQSILKTINQKFDFSLVDAVSVTQGPGLIGSLISGVSFAKSLAWVLNKPLIGINHLEGHFMSLKLSGEIKYPMIFCLVSGGHSHIFIGHEYGKYELVGKTIDDAAGEAFDKIARELGLGYPGGPIVEKMAELSKNHDRFKFTIPMQKEKNNPNFSFSGLKTQVINLIKANEKMDNDFLYDLCYCAQESIIDTVISKLEFAIQKFLKNYQKESFQIGLCGGVSANKRMQFRMSNLSKKYNCEFICPPLKYSGDNGVMIAIAGLEKFNRGIYSDLKISPNDKMKLENFI